MGCATQQLLNGAGLSKHISRFGGRTFLFWLQNASLRIQLKAGTHKYVGEGVLACLVSKDNNIQILKIGLLFPTQ